MLNKNSFHNGWHSFMEPQGKCLVFPSLGWEHLAMDTDRDIRGKTGSTFWLPPSAFNYFVDKAHNSASQGGI